MANRWKIALFVAGIVVVVLFGFSLVDISGGDAIGATALIETGTMDITGYTRAIDAYAWEFPRDFGAHPDFQTEWWYYTGNLSTDDGRRFGFQFTVFRRAITPQTESSPSEWRTNQVYLAHFTVSDIAGETFYDSERFSRSSADLAGATVDPRYRVWVEDWQIIAQNDDASQVRIQADAGTFAIDLLLDQTKAPALQGDQGLSHKSSDAGNASYYYSLSRLETAGTIRIGEETFAVDGLTWKDHEFSTSALGTGALGWDWFGLIFDDNTELMVGQIRLVDGGLEPAFGGMMVYADGTTEYLPSSQFTIRATGSWTSPHTQAVYPSGWEITVNTTQGEFTIVVTPLLLDQELANTEPRYWEGAVQISGDKTGYGYAELTGYATSMQNRF